MALQIPSTGGFIAVDTSTTNKIIQLPLTAERQGRVITIKDRTGQANIHPITIQTQGSDTFQDFSTSYILSYTFDSVTFIARSGKWLLFSITPGFPSTIQGLGTLGFISSGTLNVISTAQLTSSIQGLGTVGYLSSVPLNFISSAALFSSIQGFGSLGYVSSSQLISTTQGLTSYINSFIDPQELASTITGLGTLQFVSSIGLLSTSQGLANYITSFIDPLELASTVTGLGTAQYVSTTVTATNAIFTSSFVGLGTMGYLSSATLFSSLQGLGSMGYLSSTTLSLSSIISTPQLTSSLQGLGTLSYISSTQLTSSIQGIGQVFTSLSVNISSLRATALNVSTTGFISSLTVNSLTLGDGTGYFYMGDIVATSLSTLQINTGILIASSLQGDGSQIVNAPYISSTQLQSTVMGLGTIGYISSAYGLSVVPANFVSTLTLYSTIQGLGTLGYLSSATGLAGTVYLSSIISTPQLTSSLIGLGTLGYISSASGITVVPDYFVSTLSLYSSIQGLGTIGYVSSAQNIANLQSSFFVNSQYLISQPSYGTFTVQTGFSYTAAPWASQIVNLQTITNNFSQVQLYTDNQTLIYTGAQPQYFRITYTCGGNQNEVSVVRPTLTMQVTSQGVAKSYQTINNIESAGASVTNIIQLNPNDELIFLLRGLENYTFVSIDTRYYEIIVESVAPLAVSAFSTLAVSSLSLIDQATGNYATISLSTNLYINGTPLVLPTNLTSSVQGLTNYISSSIVPSSYQVFTVQPGVSYTGAPWATQTVQVQSVTTNFGQLHLNVDNQTIVYTGPTAQYFRITYTCGGNQNEVSVVRPTLTMQATLQGVTKSFQTVNNIESAGASVTNIVQVNPNDQFIFLIRGLENYTFATVDTTYYQITFETVGSTALTLFDQSSVSPTLYSTVTGLGTAGYISTGQLVSTTQSLLSISTFSSLQATTLKLQSPQSSSYIRQPFIQYGNVTFTDLTLNGGTSTITLPLSYTTSNSYYPFVQSANPNTTTVVSAYTVTSNQFIVQWSTLTGVNTIQKFNWNTMGT